MEKLLGKEVAEALSDAINKLTPFKPEKSDTFTFIEALSAFLIQQKSITNFRGIGRLAQWYLRFELKCPVLSWIDENGIWQAFNTLALEDGSELFDACYLTNSVLYQKGLDKHKSEIIALLKRRTDTISIKENNQNLEIEYFVNNEKSDNEQSNR